jgi:hypothetical protein
MVITVFGSSVIGRSLKFLRLPDRLSPTGCSSRNTAQKNFKNEQMLVQIYEREN